MNAFRSMRHAALAVTALAVLTATPATARWYVPRVEIGGAVVDATPLAEFLRFQNAPAPGFAEERRIELGTSAQWRFRLAFDLHPELQFGWTRSMRSADMVFAIDGAELSTGDPNPRTGQPVTVPTMDVTMDLATFRWWPEAARRHGIGPTATLGIGRVSIDQQGAFAPDFDVRTFDWSGDDMVLLAGTGLEGAWSRVRASVFVDLIRWRYEAPDEDTAGNERGDVEIPVETVVSVEFGARVAVGF